MSSYDLRSIKLPVLTGAALRIFASVVENPAGNAVLLGKLKSDAGLPDLHRLQLDEAPTFKPLVDAPEKQRGGTTAPDQVTKAPTKSQPVPSVRDYHNAYATGKTDPEQVAKRFLDALATSKQGARPLNAFIAQQPQDLLAQAAASAARWKAGTPRSVFDGVPVAVKDEMNQVPYPTTTGTKFLAAGPVGTDATLVGRLRAAGALLVGKANMHEIGINPNGHNMHWGTVRNPYNLGHDTGGSSSGSAAAVAAGLCPVAIGADGGGSIRIPASLCGVVGFKATYGRISEHGVTPLCWSVGHVGPLGWSVEDVALAYAVIAGADPGDSTTMTQPTPTLEGWADTNLTGLKLGIFRPWFEHAQNEVVAANQRTVERLRSLGAEIIEIDIPDLNGMRVAHAISILSEMVTCMDGRKAPSENFAPAVRINLTVGRSFSAEDYVTAQRMRTRAMATFDTVFAKVDALLTPSTATTAPAIREDAVQAGWSDLSATTEIMRYVVPGNFVGLPAISVPVGYDSNGLPIGMQIMARHWRDDLCLRLALAVEQGIERKPAQLQFNLLG